MRSRPCFLGVEHVLAIHERMTHEFGGEPGVRDRGLLESAAAMPAATFDGALLHKGLPAMAAAYLFHLCRNHPFLDGNKRVALAAAEVFLELNGYRLDADNDAIEALVMGVASGTVSKEQTTRFFRKHVRR